MTIYIDPATWPAHGTVWSHLISDESYAELHAFAAELRLPRRGFDLDHYDVPASRYEAAIALGAVPIAARDVVRLLQDSGLRVAQRDRDALRPIRRREYLQEEWERLAAPSGLAESATAKQSWSALGEELLGRWNESHRSYHDERHLEDVLLALNHLEVRGAQIPVTTFLAAWFHDAVYAGNAGQDEQDSAELAQRSLLGQKLEASLAKQLAELILATTPGSNALEHFEPSLAASAEYLLDADLSIFASSDERYLEYSAAVRDEYAEVPESVFRKARARILRNYLERDSIYFTPEARQLWQSRARENLIREIAVLEG
ncbi:MAG: DUF4031 domain-containing protein [Microbacteriaceae bacterium]